jgi:hypothetical protein
MLGGLTNLLIGSDYSDLCYGYFAFRRGTVDMLDLRSDGFEIETEINIKAHRAGLRIAEVPSCERDRQHGSSNLSVLRDGPRILLTIFRSRRAIPYDAEFGKRVVSRRPLYAGAPYVPAQYHGVEPLTRKRPNMDPIEKVSFAGSAAIMTAIVALFAIGLAIGLTGHSGEEFVRELPAADPGTVPFVGEESEVPDKTPPASPPGAVAALASAASPTPTPGNRYSNDGPTGPAEARVLSEDGLSVQALGPLPSAAPRHESAPLPTPLPGGGGSPQPDPTPEPLPTITPLPTPVDRCLQPESSIVVDNHRVHIDRGSIISYNGAVLNLSTSDGPITLVVNRDTQILGDLSVASQVRAEAHQTGSGKIIARVVEVLCVLAL